MAWRNPSSRRAQSRGAASLRRPLLQPAGHRRRGNVLAARTWRAPAWPIQRESSESGSPTRANPVGDTRQCACSAAPLPRSRPGGVAGHSVAGYGPKGAVATAPPPSRYSPQPPRRHAGSDFARGSRPTNTPSMPMLLRRLCARRGGAKNRRHPDRRALRALLHGRVTDRESPLRPRLLR